MLCMKTKEKTKKLPFKRTFTYRTKSIIKKYKQGDNSNAITVGLLACFLRYIFLFQFFFENGTRIFQLKRTIKFSNGVYLTSTSP